MKLSRWITERIALADEKRVEKALAGLQDGTIIVHILGYEAGIITATVHSSRQATNDKIYSVMLGGKKLACTCPDFLFGRGKICKHIISCVMKLEEMPVRFDNSHMIHIM